MAYEFKSRADRMGAILEHLNGAIREVNDLPDCPNWVQDYTNTVTDFAADMKVELSEPGEIEREEQYAAIQSANDRRRGVAREYAL
ncbi:hypothetical protein J2D73_20090 [Acetobacter sacchari]|uniref:Uncharacterized protein n=1 Tax=Acetobacter sacchari TaxID=2661687 RepID=A0ABS3M1K7_9PROT|nr:hypothetical protein [Acetobacter sacchari]MBO1362081.1 hypothetical protein [Acetobacter sacchari]